MQVEKIIFHFLLRNSLRSILSLNSCNLPVIVQSCRTIQGSTGRSRGIVTVAVMVLIAQPRLEISNFRDNWGRKPYRLFLFGLSSLFGFLNPGYCKSPFSFVLRRCRYPLPRFSCFMCLFAHAILPGRRSMVLQLQPSR